MTKEQFIEKLKAAVAEFPQYVQDKEGQWVVKGFIDIYKNIYTISTDTKVVSKIIELYIFPLLNKFAEDNGLILELTKEQNFYPDMTFIDKNDQANKFAVDLKSSYRKNKKSINGMTLGAFTGYFRNREDRKNVTYPYKEYKGHIVLGIIYDVSPVYNDERKSYKLEDLGNIPSVIENIQFFVQEKWKIATDRPGSGNTKNIGSVTSIEDLINGNGVFSELGEEVFDDYWINYLTSDMAKAIELPHPPYNNLQSYKKFKNLD